MSEPTPSSSASENEPSRWTGPRLVERLAPWSLAVVSAVAVMLAWLAYGPSAPRSPGLVELAAGLLLALALGWLLQGGARRLRRHQEASSQALAERQRERQRERQAHAYLRAVENRFRSVFHTATDALLVLDDKGRVQEANPAAGAMFGFPAEGLSGVDVRTLIPADQFQIYDDFRRQLRKHKQVRLDSRAVSQDGTPFDVEVRGSVFYEDDAPRVLAILTDVTERRRAEGRLKQLSHRILMAQEAERERVSRDLHDELGQIITAMRFELGLLQKRPPDTAEQAAETVRGIAELVERAAAELRRVCQGLRPPLLDDLGLGPAVVKLCDQFQEVTDIGVTLDLRVPEVIPGLSPAEALCTYRILQESLTNVSRHAGADQVSVSLVQEYDELLLSVYDNGHGFDLEIDEPQGAGLIGMRERAHLVGGSLEIRSLRNEGTRVTFHQIGRAHV